MDRTFEALIGEFARETGLGLEIDDKGSCSVITGETIVTIQYREETDDVALFSAVTAPEDAMSPAVMREALKLALDECGDDPEALEVVLKDVTANIMRGDDTLRSAETIKKRVAGLKANFDELRELAKDAPGLFPVAKRFMILLKGKSFPPGALTKVIETIRNAPTPKLAGVSLRTSAYGIHKALEDYRKICDQAVQESGMGEHLEGGDENTPFRDFVSRLLLAKFSRPQLRNVQLALEDTETGFVVSLYNRIGLQKYTAPKMDHTDRNSVSVEAQGRIMTMTEMKCVIDALLGDEDEDICQKPPKGVEVPEGLPFALLDDLCEYCEVPKDHRPE